MRYIQLAGVCLIAILAMCTTATAEASATEYLYKVNGSNLEAGQTKEITAKAKTEFTITAEETILGTKIRAIIKCGGLKLAAAEKPKITGGIPGRSEERIEYERCTATLGGTRCERVVIVNISWANLIVKALASIAKIAIAFKPLIGKVMMTTTLTKCGIFGSHEMKIEGTTAALVIPEKAEQVAGVLVWSEAEPITEIENSSGSKEKIGLKFAGNPATINGEMEVELVSREKWGVF